MTPDTAQILAFLAVADCGSFSAAARELHLSQPAVSKRVRQIEAVLGQALFDRIGHRVRLTEAGAALLPVARRLRQDLEEARQVVSDTTGPVRGRLALVTSHHIGLHRLPDILLEYVRRHPGVRPDLAFKDSEQAFRAVEQGSYELAIVTLPEQVPPALTVRLLWEDPLAIVVSEDHPLARTAPPDPTTLARYRAILPARHTVTRRRIDHWLEQAGSHAADVMEVNYLETIATLVRIGLGWSALPRALLGPGLQVLDFGRPPPMRQLGLARHREVTPTRAGRALEALLPGHGARPTD
ncbi:MAG: LysR family transcriptional regulator [Halothiobacillaceae bacterium]